MARPVSSASSTQSAPTHRRNPSSTTTAKSSSRSLTPSLVSLYLTNLRLLDLDLLPDWPGITASTFTTSSDTRARLRCAEWSLYRLFRLYDAHLAAERLQPFFPPLEPLQSVNLRAALYRCLAELKKSGALGRETVLRKTMMDDCAGDKFWEVCLAFSALVLRKATLGAREPQGRPRAQTLGLAHGMSRKEKENLLPLAIAHKVALADILADKNRRREGYMRLYDLLKEKEEELARRMAEVQRQQQEIDETPIELKSRLSSVEQNVRRIWVGSDSLRDTLISGGRAMDGERLLLQDTDAFLDQAGDGDSDRSSQQSRGILEDIESKARAQNARVKRWQKLYDQLNASKADPTRPPVAKASANGIDLRFNQHHDLNDTGSHYRAPDPASQPGPRPPYVSRYDDILTTMREELRLAHTARRATEPDVDFGAARKPSITLDAVAGAPPAPPSRSSSQRSISPSLPLRGPGSGPGPGLVRRASSRSRSYQQPKVVSQREPIPLKSELFSPLKSSRPGSGSLISASPWLASPAEEGPPAIGSGAIDGIVGVRSSRRQSPSGAVGLGLDLSGKSPLDGDRPDSGVATSGKLGLPPQSGPVLAAPHASLAERTRMSMTATAGAEDGLDPADAPALAPSPTRSPLADDIPHGVAPSSISLAERTRQSMSATAVSLSPPPSAANPASPPPHPSRTSAQSTDPTPPSASRSPTGSGPATAQAPLDAEAIDRAGAQVSAPVGTGAARLPRPRNVTPRERLFDTGAEYGSVFKSRPKVALSPVLGPAAEVDEEPEAGDGAGVRGHERIAVLDG